MDLSRRSPGTHEAAVLERMTELVEAGMEEFDLVVFDTAPSGHTARLMALPEMMTAWTDGLLKRRDRSAKLGAAMRGLDRDADRGKTLLGNAAPRDPIEERDDEIRSILLRRRDRLAGLREVLTDSAVCSFAIVLAAERLPVLETIELHQELTRTGVDVGALVVNKRSPAWPRRVPRAPPGAGGGAPEDPPHRPADGAAAGGAAGGGGRGGPGGAGEVRGAALRAPGPQTHGATAQAASSTSGGFGFSVRASTVAAEVITPPNTKAHEMPLA